MKEISKKKIMKSYDFYTKEFKETSERITMKFL